MNFNEKYAKNDFLKYFCKFLTTVDALNDQKIDFVATLGRYLGNQGGDFENFNFFAIFGNSKFNFWPEITKMVKISRQNFKFSPDYSKKVVSVPSRYWVNFGTLGYPPKGY